MSALSLIVMLVFTFLAVFVETKVYFIRHLLGAQIDFLPALVMYASLSGNPLLTSLMAVFGGLWVDSLSMNPLGISIIPLMLIGMAALHFRELVLREQFSAQFILGLSAGAAVPVMQVLLLLTLGEQPLIGWGSLWQLFVMSLASGFITPVVFRVFDYLERWLNYQPMPETTFNTNREMKRGRS